MKTKPIIQKVIFRAERRKSAEITAVMTGQDWRAHMPLTVWDSQGGHSGGSLAWYYSTRPAKPKEYASELAKLRRCYAPKYKIQVVKRLTRNRP